MRCLYILILNNVYIEPFLPPPQRRYFGSIFKNTIDYYPIKYLLNSKNLH